MGIVRVLLCFGGVLEMRMGGVGLVVDRQVAGMVAVVEMEDMSMGVEMVEKVFSDGS